MNKYTHQFLIAFLFFSSTLFSQVTLSHNVGNTVIPNSMYSCSWGGMCWARKFILSDFGIAANQSFTITRGEVGLFSGINWDTNLQFNIYAIDTDFPASFSDSNLIGSSQVVPIPMNININQIITVDFATPVVVPAGTGMILVEVFQLNSQSSEAHAFVAGTAFDNDFSWVRSRGTCPPYMIYKSTVELNRPDAKFYITVSGESSTLSLSEHNRSSGTVLYPNPVKGDLFFQAKENVFKAAVYDLTGRLVLSPEVHDNKANVAALKRGTYILKMFMDSGEANVKIMKE